MTNDQYREAIDALGLSQVGAARFFGVDARTSRRWASGELDVPHAVAMLLRVMSRMMLTPADVERIATGKRG